MQIYKKKIDFQKKNGRKIQQKLNITELIPIITMH